MKLIKKDFKINIDEILDRVFKTEQEENILLTPGFWLGVIKEFPVFLAKEVTTKEFWRGYLDFLLLKKPSYFKITLEEIEEVREDPKRNKRIKHKNSDIKYIKQS